MRQFMQQWGYPILGYLVPVAYVALWATLTIRVR